MSYLSTLERLESVLESFLERATAARGQRLEVLDGINGLDDIARSAQQGQSIVDPLGDWFADHQRWLSRDWLRPQDFNRISRILAEISGEMRQSVDDSPSACKIHSELDRWTEQIRQASQRLVLKRGPEATAPARSRTTATFDGLLARLQVLCRSYATDEKHLMSILDKALQEASVRHDKDALLLSGFVIYYLKLNGYKVEPYVQRLKQAEVGIRVRNSHA